jgi:hypothetical protein
VLVAVGITDVALVPVVVVANISFLGVMLGLGAVGAF